MDDAQTTGTPTTRASTTSDATPSTPLRIGMIGYAFMGAVHAHAWRHAR